MEVRELIALLNTPGVGIVRARRLVDHFGSPEVVFSAPLKQILSVPDIGRKTAESIVSGRRDYTQAHEQLRKAAEFGATVLTLWDNDYPPFLKNIYDPPPILFIEGKLDWKDSPAIAVVGTRKPSQYGAAQTKNIVEGLAHHGLTIMSGMARGVDSIAHKAALSGGGMTVAVLGCGLDRTYPPENKGLRDRIVGNGAVISEFPFGTPPEAKNFPRRNRIISGLCLGTLVVEAGDRSGALITAEYSLNQNREAFALPGDINRPQSMGCNRLIRESGALLISSENDILNAINLSTAASSRVKSQPKPKPKLNIEEEKIYNNLDSEPIYIDDLAIKSNTTPTQALTILLGMEMRGIVRKLQGNYYVRD